MTDNYLFQTYLPLVADLVCLLVWFTMPGKLLTFKKNKKWLFVLMILLNLVESFFFRTYSILMTTPLKSVICFAQFFAYIFIAYIGTKSKKLIAFSLCLGTILFVDVLTVLVMSVLQINTPEALGGLPLHFVSGMLCAFFAYVMMFGVSLLYNKIKYKKITNKIWQFQVIVISQSLLMIIVSYSSFKNDNTIENMLIKTPGFAVMMVIAMIVVILADIFLYRILLTNSQNYELKRELEIMQVKEELELEYYEKLKKSINETRKLNHDFSNAVTVIEGIINSPDIQENQKLASTMLDEVKETLRQNKVRYYCENELVNLIVINKTEKIIENGIDFSVNLNIPNNINIKNFDLCRIFTNIIDNACDASLSATNRKDCFIVLSSKIEEDYIYITCENYYDTPLNINGDRFISSKEEHKGLGIEIIKEIAKAYSGNVKIKHCNNIFSVSIMLKNK